jgi:hypothetical protein
MGASILLLVVILAVGALIISAVASWLRSVMLWYWRVDEGIGLLREIRDELRQLNSSADDSAGADVLKFPRKELLDRFEPR